MRNWFLFLTILFFVATLFEPDKTFSSGKVPESRYINHKTKQCGEFSPGDSFRMCDLPKHWVKDDSCPSGYKEIDLIKGVNCQENTNWYVNHKTKQCAEMTVSDAIFMGCRLLKNWRMARGNSCPSGYKDMSQVKGFNPCKNTIWRVNHTTKQCIELTFDEDFWCRLPKNWARDDNIYSCPSGYKDMSQVKGYNPCKEVTHWFVSHDTKQCGEVSRSEYLGCKAAWRLGLYGSCPPGYKEIDWIKIINITPPGYKESDWIKIKEKSLNCQGTSAGFSSESKFQRQCADCKEKSGI